MGARLDGYPAQLDQLVQLRTRAAYQAAPPAGWLEYFRCPDVPDGTAAHDRRIAGHVQYWVARAATGLRQERRVTWRTARAGPMVRHRRVRSSGAEHVWERRQWRAPRSRHQQRRFRDSKEDPGGRIEAVRVSRGGV